MKSIVDAIIEQYKQVLADGEWRGGSNHENNSILWIGIDEQAELITRYIKPLMNGNAEFERLCSKPADDITGTEDEWMCDFENLAQKKYNEAEKHAVFKIFSAVVVANI